MKIHCCEILTVHCTHMRYYGLGIRIAKVSYPIYDHECKDQLVREAKVCRKKTSRTSGNPKNKGQIGKSCGKLNASDMDVRALRRMVEWALELNERQRAVLLSAQEVLTGDRSAKANDPPPTVF